jgi:hypothetical protein
VFNTFVVDKIVLKAKKIAFEYEPASKTESITTLGLVSQHDQAAAAALRSRLVCYPRLKSFEAKILLSRSLHIDKNRTLQIQCSSGWNDIRQIELQLRSASAGLRLRTADATIISETAKLVKPKTPGVIEALEMPPESVTTIHIPYNLEDDLREISIRMDITYVTPEGKFEYLSNPTIRTELPVDVNVHDFFKSALLFSRFQIRSSTGMPLQILGVNLEGTDRFTAQPPPCTLTPMLVFPNQPATILYKIKQTFEEDPEKKQVRQSIAEESPLTLTIDYCCVDECVVVAAETVFTQAVSKSPFAPLRPLLLQTFSRRLREAMPLKLFSQAAMLHELRVPSYQSMKWNLLLDSLSTTLCATLRPWLQSWHTENTIVPISYLGDDDSAISETLSHRIIMNVPLPRLHILQTVSITLPRSESKIYSTGSLIPATVIIKHTRRWDTPDHLKTISLTPDAPLEFVFEIDAPSDAWIIGGQRRTKFTAKEDEIKSWTFMIMPLRIGRLLLPTVDIRALGKGTVIVSCETDLRSLGDTAVVVADLESTTVGLTENSNGGDAILLESKKRHS